MAGRIPQQFIQELLAQTDIAEVIRRFVPLKRAGSEYKACCPFHTEKTPSFTVSPAKGFYYCFGCQAGGNAIGFLMDYAKLGYVDAVEELAARLGRDVPREGGGSAPGEDDDMEALRALMEQACRYYQHELKGSAQAKKYAKSRGLSGEICMEYRVGFAPAGFDNIQTAFGKKYTRKLLQKAGLLKERDGRTYDWFRNRLMFPIRDFRGRVVGFGGRSIDPEDQPKYLNSPETPLFRKKRVLYGAYELQKRRSKPRQLVLTEGYMDVVALAQAGVGDALATLGTATTPEHIRALGRFCRRCVFCFDGDRAGRQAGWKALLGLLEAFQDGDEIRFAHLPEGEDPDSYVRAHGADGWKKFLKTATPMEEYVLEHLAERVDLSHASGKAAFAKEAQPLLANLRAPVFRELLAQELADKVGLAPARLLRGAAPAPAPARAPARRGKPTFVRLMVRMLLEYPELAREALEMAPLELDGAVSNLDVLRAHARPGCALLAEMIELASDTPDIKTGGMVEHFRGREEHRHLVALKGWMPVQLSKVGGIGDVRAMFRDYLRKLQDEYLRDEHRKLADKQADGGSLSDREQSRERELKRARRELHAPVA